ncbi:MULTISPECIES: three-helix bundle dimerization domain-containing protein [Kribbella]|uniref:Arsenate reductase ArsC n=1 Tax=Kribbella sancticallisti TaxID=460087 RepID=A0ABP4Q9Z4_9ACTN|nr:low molecular weight phosphatase family protein [Kribbella catacumbae]
MPTSAEELALLDTDMVLGRAAERLADKYTGIFSPETVDRVVHESYVALYRTARVHRHLSALAEHFASDRLAALAHAKGAIASPVPQVLFLCVANAGRSQMAAALLAHHAAGAVTVRSAGSHPAADIETPVAAALAELGLDLHQAYPKPLTDDVVRAADVVVTMGCGDACPVLPGKRYYDWAIDDPAGQSPAAIRRIRDDIDTRVQTLLAELVDQKPGVTA